MKGHIFGFRLVGPCSGERRLVDAAAAFAAYAACDERAEINREAYLSAFCFGDDFAEHLRNTRSTKDFSGSCWSPWIWWDIDRNGDLEAARKDAAKLSIYIGDRYHVADYNILLFFSGAKGFHLGLPTIFMTNAVPSASFNIIAKSFAIDAATCCGARIDPSIYDKVRAFRAPNSRHPKTGLYKRHLPVEALLELSIDAILDLARAPEPFDIPSPTPDACRVTTEHDWTQAELKTIGLKVTRVGKVADRRDLNRATLDFIRDGAQEGDRHRLLFSAAANLAEFSCPAKLAHALLTPAALDSGLSPSEVHRQIECGLKRSASPAEPATLAQPAPDKNPTTSVTPEEPASPGKEVPNANEG